MSVVMLKILTFTAGMGLALMSCSGKSATASVSEEAAAVPVAFNADSAYRNVARQVEFGPRVPGTDAHRKCGDWLAARLRATGAEVVEQKAEVTAFDGTRLPMRNIFARFNAAAPRRLLLLAHWDCRPWADMDSDSSKHGVAVDGANDGASGVGVLLELARLLGEKTPESGVDILFVDAEDWGEDGDDDSWALGARYFAQHPPVEGYMPDEAILLDMVGDPDAVFCREYFSEQAAPGLAARVRAAAQDEGVAHRFPDRFGSAVTDDHVKLIEAGIPAIDIIDYRDAEQSFVPTWHTTSDNMDHISKTTLGEVGRVITRLVYNY